VLRVTVERAPNIAEDGTRMSYAHLFEIIQNGIPGTGMPAFHTLSASQIDTLIEHMRTLGGPGKSAELPGDPASGKSLFEKKAGCSQCHMVSGDGGFIASDLTEYGRGHSAEQIRKAILNPGSSSGGAVRIATVKLRSGEELTGRVRNEDNFSIQIQDLKGTYHLVSRSDVKDVGYDSKSMMPGDYGTTLTAKELDDLVSYLVHASGLNNARPDKAGGENCFPFCGDSDD